MNKSYFTKSICGIVLTGLLATMLCGCNKAGSIEVAVIEKDEYQKNGYETTTIKRGDIDSTLELSLKKEIEEEIEYSVEEADLEVDQILVNIGEQVKAGQVLVTFEAEELKKEITKYSAQVEKCRLMLEHYKRLANIDKKKDYKVEVEEMTDNLNLAQLYLDEENKRLQNCSIIAKQDGTISFISKTLSEGYVAPFTCMVTEICGQSRYTAETKDDYEFHIGDVFLASSDTIECNMKVTAIEDIVGEGTEGNTTRKITFEPEIAASDLGSEGDFSISIAKPKLTDVVFVPSLAINKKEDKEFVYVVSKDGFLDAVYVQTGESIDGMTIIKKGLNGGEEVVTK